MRVIVAGGRNLTPGGKGTANMKMLATVNELKIVEYKCLKNYKI